MAQVSGSETDTQNTQLHALGAMINSLSPKTETTSLSSVLNLLAEWRHSIPTRAVEAAGISYDRIYHYSRGVTLPNFDTLAAIALRLDDIPLNPNSDWKSSSRLALLTECWLTDCAILNRPLPISIFIMGAELAALFSNGEPMASTTAALQMLPLRTQTITDLARHLAMEYFEITEACSSIENLLQVKLFDEAFPDAFDAIPPRIHPVFEPLREGLRERGYDNEDLALIFSHKKSGIDRVYVSRCLKGDLLRSGVGPGYLEFLAHRDVGEIAAGLTQQFALARELRQRKGRFDPHPSVLIRDVFALSEDCSEEFTAQTITAYESRHEHSVPLVTAMLREAHIGLVPVLSMALQNRLEREPFLESNNFFETIVRLSRMQLLSKGVMGVSRMRELLDGSYLPPLSQVHRLLEQTGVPATVEVSHRILYGDRNGGDLNAAQRFIDSLCQEQAESRNAYREAHATGKSPWSKSAFERFFRSLAGGPYETQSHIRRVVKEFSSDDQMRVSILSELQAAFADQVSGKELVSYVKAVQKVCSNDASIDTWLGQQIMLSSPIIRGEHLSRDQLINERDIAQLFNRLREITTPINESARYHHWVALRSLLQALPGVTFSELLQIVQERGAVPAVEQPNPRWVEFDALAMISQALDDSQRSSIHGETDYSSENVTSQYGFKGWSALEIVEDTSCLNEVEAFDEATDDEDIPNDIPSESEVSELQESYSDETDSDEALISIQHFEKYSQQPHPEELPEIEMELSEEDSDNPHGLQDTVSAIFHSVNIESPASRTSEEILAAAYFLQRTVQQRGNRDDSGHPNTVPEELSDSCRERKKSPVVDKLTPQMGGASETEPIKERKSRPKKSRSESGSENKGTRASSKQSALDPERARLLEMYKKRHETGKPIFDGDEMD